MPQSPGLQGRDADGPAAADGAPPPWFIRRIGDGVDARRNFLLALVFALAFLVATGALVVVARSHVVQPFVLRAGDDGAVAPAAARLQVYHPGAPERRYFLAQWTRHLLALDARLSEGWLAEAYRLTRGKATSEFTDWLRTAAPLQRLRQDASLTRAVEILGISLIDDEVALVRVALEERSLGSPLPVRRKQLVTVHFRTVEPSSEEEVLRNPIGLLVTDFQVGQDLEH